MKAVLLIDEMPKTCLDCPLNGYENVCNVTLEDNYDYLTERPSWCPLKSLPSEKNHINILGENGTYARGFEDGWNACIEEIEK